MKSNLKIPEQDAKIPKKLFDLLYATLELAQKSNGVLTLADCALLDKARFDLEGFLIERELWDLKSPLPHTTMVPQADASIFKSYHTILRAIEMQQGTGAFTISESSQLILYLEKIHGHLVECKVPDLELCRAHVSLPNLIAAFIALILRRISRNR